MASSSSAALGVRFNSAGKLFPAPRRDRGLGLADAWVRSVTVMLSFGDAAEFMARWIPITPMPTVAKTRSAVVSLALDIRIKRRVKRLRTAPAPVTPAEATNLTELRLATRWRSEEHTSELQSLTNLVC